MPDERGFTVNDPEHLEEARRGASYAIYDTQDGCWLGDERGPRVYTHEDSRALNGMPLGTLSKIAAMIAAEQLGYAPGRLEAREFRGESLRLKDEVPVVMTAHEALIKIEGGAE
jgi:hypothetical protein